MGWVVTVTTTTKPGAWTRVLPERRGGRYQFLPNLAALLLTSPNQADTWAPGSPSSLPCCCRLCGDSGRGVGEKGPKSPWGCI